MSTDKLAHLWLGIRSVAMTILFPGFVVGLIPFTFIIQKDVPKLSQWSLSQFMATFVIGIGLAVLLRCIWEFAHIGKGTLAPFDEPRKLVIQGLYRYVRNPMYVGVYLILLGETWFFLSPGVLIWTGVFFLASNIVVIAFEEPRLRNKFGLEYNEYCHKVGRWIPGKAFRKEV